MEIPFGYSMNDPLFLARAPEESAVPVCEICGCECETIYKDKHGVVFGCENCIETVDAYDYQDENEDRI